MPTALAAVDGNYTGNIIFGGVDGTVLTTNNASSGTGSTWASQASNSGGAR